VEETFRFTARVVERWQGKQRQVQIVPENAQEFLSYLERARLGCRPDWHGDELYVTVSRRSLVERSRGVERVQYAVRAKQTMARRIMCGIDLVPL
jgi:hypothetical protein